MTETDTTADEQPADLTRFLTRYCEEDIREGVRSNDSEYRLPIDYEDLFAFSVQFADRLIDDPVGGEGASGPLDELRDALKHVAAAQPADTTDWRIAIENPPRSVKVPELRTEDADSIIEIEGQMSEVTQVHPHIELATWVCETCGGYIEVVAKGDSVSKPNRCYHCERQTTLSLVDDRSEFIDRQLGELTARPEDTAGFTQSSIPVYFEDDLCGEVQPGDRVSLTGILHTDHEKMLNERNPDASREFYFEPMTIEQEQRSFTDIDPQRKESIEELADDPQLFEKLIGSFAPHVVTDEIGDMRKLGIVLQLFGGVHRAMPNGDTTRGDIHVLLLGEPGTAKSQYLKYAHKLSPKSVLASGKGASAAGLTAATTQSSLTNEWSVKAGAMVLANDGLACIDEIDKIQDDARKSLHEALEDQHVPINKAGQNVVLPAKTSLLAAGNPEHGRLDAFEPLSEQVNLGPALLSRFDLVFSVSDDPDPDHDASVADNQFSFADSDLPERMRPAIDPELLREYIAYARQKFTPVWADDSVKQSAVEWYTDIRASVDETATPVGPRVNDALRRLATASAKARLSSTIDAEDVQRAKELMETYLNQVAETDDGVFDKYKGQGSTPTNVRQRMDIIKAIIADFDDKAPLSDVLDRAKERGMDEQQINHAISKMKQNGEIYEPDMRKYRVA